MRAIWLLIGCLALPLVAQSTAVFEAPRRYQKPDAPRLDMSPQAAVFVRFGREIYSAAHSDAVTLGKAIDTFLAEPNNDTLASARDAWRAARPAYGRSETLRFINSPIDHPGDATVPPGPELRINAWPVNEAVIDAVKGDPTSGLITSDIALDTQTLIRSNQASDEADITLGWHAIEFLLWGQDFNSSGPGDRAASDFVPGTAINERRRQYLKLATDILIADLASVAAAWRDESTLQYGQWLEKQPAVEVVGRALHGAASLAAIELYGERMTVALDSRSQEDEHSCFSDNTLADLASNLEGIRELIAGTRDGEPTGDSVIALVRWKDPALADRLSTALDAARDSLATLDEPFDQIILAPDDAPIRARAEATASRMRDIAVALKASAETLGIDIVVPGV